MRALIALGGNALLGGGEPVAAGAQPANVALAAAALAGVAEQHELVLTHGKGPQAGPLGRRSEGMTGYMLELALRNALPGRDLVTVLSAVVVSADDPAFAAPSQPTGPDGRGFGRRVPAPEPQAIVELRSMRTLIDAGALVICAAGGGIPVALDDGGTMHAVEAAVDRDLTAALLARRLDADLLVLLTDVDAVRLDWGGADERPLGRVTPAELRRHDFAAGSIGPKVDAACRFVEATGRRAAIGDLRKAAEIVRGVAGTQVCAASA